MPYVTQPYDDAENYKENTDKVLNIPVLDLLQISASHLHSYLVSLVLHMANHGPVPQGIYKHHLFSSEVGQLKENQ